jgi:hypothetical protein
MPKSRNWVADPIQKPPTRDIFLMWCRFHHLKIMLCQVAGVDLVTFGEVPWESPLAKEVLFQLCMHEGRVARDGNLTLLLVHIEHARYCGHM